jgi:phosphocarrier protein HPr
MTAAGGATGQALSRRVTIVNERGLHARAAARFAKLAAEFDARVTVSRGGQTVTALSIMGLMMLAAATGSEIELRAEGADAEAAMAALAALVERGFDEE